MVPLFCAPVLRKTGTDTPLQQALEERDEAAIHQLLEEGADIHHRDVLGETALHVACKRGLTDFVKILLDKGADVNYRTKYNSIPIRIALENDDLELFRLLLQRGAIVNEPIFLQDSLLDIAVLEKIP